MDTRRATDRSGTQEYQDAEIENAYEETFNGLMDEDEVYETFLGGTWAPYNVVAATDSDILDPATGITYDFIPAFAPTRQGLQRLPQWNSPEAVINVDVGSPANAQVDAVSRVGDAAQRPLAENATGESGTLVKMNLRRHDSVDKRGRTAAEGGNADEANSQAAPAWMVPRLRRWPRYRGAPQHGVRGGLVAQRRQRKT